MDTWIDVSNFDIRAILGLSALLPQPWLDTGNHDSVSYTTAIKTTTSLLNKSSLYVAIETA